MSLPAPSLAEPEIPLPLLVDNLTSLARALDAASPDQRVNWMRGLGGRQLRAMYGLARGSLLRAEELTNSDGSVATCEGRNALPLFCFFQKRFARSGEEIVGYNHNSRWMMSLVGPGHFVAYDSPDVPGEVWIDYRALPKVAHPQMPPLLPNENGLGARLTYAGMVDVVRRVSEHVFIGDSFIAGKPRGVAFALCRPPQGG
jgi:hypothetical protein